MEEFNKVTVGFVVQHYKVKNGKTVCCKQEFVASDHVDFEDKHGEALKTVPQHEDQPFTMIVTDEKAKFSIMNELENEILEVVDDQDEYTRSDLQGRVTAIVMKAMSWNVKR